MLPHDEPPYSTVYYYFRRWQKRGLWEQINSVLREQIRIKLWHFSPSYCRNYR